MRHPFPGLIRHTDRPLRSNALRSTLLLSAALVAGMPAAGSNGPELVADLEPTGAGSAPLELVRSGNQVFFTASDGDHGRELWVSDGTTEGTRLVKDIEPGAAGSGLWSLTDADGTLYFIDYREGSTILWRSDGTSAGTRPVGPIPLERGDELSASVGSSVLFLGRDREHWVEPWVSDGTPAGTRMLHDIKPGRGGSWPRAFVAMGGVTYFLASDGVHGEEIWRTDGTSAGTSRLTDLGPPPSTLTVVGERLFFFTAGEEDQGRDLWVSDGTVEGTRLAARIDPGSDANIESVVAAGDRLAFILRVFDKDVSELWASDGTADGTLRVATLEGLDEPVLVPAGDQAFLVADRERPRRIRGVAKAPRRYVEVVEGTRQSVFEVWRSDGTPAGTFRLRTVLGDVDWPTIAAGGSLYVYADDGVHGTELWTSDGTEQGTRLVDDILPGRKSSQPTYVEPFAAFDDAMLFVAEDREHGSEIWRTDGTEAGTRLVRDIRTGGASSGIGQLVAQGRRLWFVTQADWDDDTGRNVGPVIWRTDATGRGTRKVIAGDEILGTAGTGPYGLTALGRSVAYFVSHPSGMALGLSDGTRAGTDWVDGWANAAEPWCRFGTVILRRVLYAGCSDGLVRSDGTPRGSSYLLKGRPYGRLVSGLVGLGGRAHFLVERMRPGWSRYHHVSTALWRTDGTRRGTERIVSFDLGPAAQTRLTSARGHLYLSYAEPSEGREPWISDGTMAGTQRLTAIRPGPQGSWPSGFAAAPGGVWFSADDGTRGREPWMSDGTASGTRLLLDIRTGRRGSNPASGVRIGDRLFFAAEDGRHGRELWVTDGTPTGTRLVRDLAPGRADSSPRRLTRFGDQIVFVASDRMGAELWLTDGTARGTRRVADLRPGEKGSRPELLVATTDAVYFIADDGRHGRELWRYAP